MKTELENLRQFKSGVEKETCAAFIAAFGNVKDHLRFEKAKEFFTLPEIDADGNPKWDKVNDEATAENLTEMKKLERLDYFIDSQPKKNVDGVRKKQKKRTPGTHQSG